MKWIQIMYCNPLTTRIEFKLHLILLYQVHVGGICSHQFGAYEFDWDAHNNQCSNNDLLEMKKKKEKQWIKIACDRHR